MLYTYTPEQVGGTIIYNTPTGIYRGSQELYFGDSNFVSIQERENDGLLIIIVFENRITKKVISNRKLKFKEHPTDNYFYPEIE